MDNDRPYWNMEIEPLLNTPEMEKIQLGKIRKMLARLKSGSAYYKRQFEETGLDPEQIKNIDEFKKQVGLFNKRKLLQLIDESGGDLVKALEQLLPVSVSELACIATTTGTTGAPTPYPFTWRDINNLWGEALARSGWRAGIRPHDRILFAFALSMVVAGVPNILGLQKLGAMILPVGAEAGAERILNAQVLYRGTVFMGTPSLAEYLIEKCPEILGKSVKELGFKTIVCGGEPGPGIPEVKKKLEDAYGCRVFDGGAGFGCSCDHEEYQGMHWLGDDLVYYELVDPETGDPIPFENGAIGEACFTTLEAEGMTMLRQSMGDIHQVFTEPCPCGKSGFRYKILGRRDNMLKVKGVAVYPSRIRGVINGFIPRVTGTMRIILDEKPPRVAPPLKIKVEYADNVKSGALDQLAGEISDAMHNQLKIRPRIIWTPPGSLGRSHYKGDLFERNYKE